MKTEIILPTELYKLGLEEIGAIFVLMSSPYMEYKYKLFWENHRGFQQAISVLKEDEIIVDKENDFQIDLTWV
jgi:hypothetical protein